MNKKTSKPVNYVRLFLAFFLKQKLSMCMYVCSRRSSYNTQYTTTQYFVPSKVVFVTFANKKQAEKSLLRFVIHPITLVLFVLWSTQQAHHHYTIYQYFLQAVRCQLASYYTYYIPHAQLPVKAAKKKRDIASQPQWVQQAK